jgi:hypothetical protein|tara:strand:+ start:195 stop:713 length:519 start_codon:yes stop_codon:yes gene_type:complete
MEIPLIISGVSAFIGAVVYKGGATLSIKYAEKLKRTIEKKRLKNEIQNTIQNLKFLEFQNVNYKMKVYDNNYNKQLYVKMKNIYRYTDDEVSKETSFLKRFDISYTRFDSYKPYLQQMVKEEVENSIKRSNSIYEIQRSVSNYKLELNDDINLNDMIDKEIKGEIIEDIKDV